MKKKGRPPKDDKFSNTDKVNELKYIIARKDAKIKALEMENEPLAYRKEVRPEVKYSVIYCHKDKCSISKMCRFFEVSRSGYYGFVKRIDKPAKDLELSEYIRKCQLQDIYKSEHKPCIEHDKSG